MRYDVLLVLVGLVVTVALMRRAWRQGTEADAREDMVIKLSTRSQDCGQKINRRTS